MFDQGENLYISDPSGCSGLLDCDGNPFLSFLTANYLLTRIYLKHLLNF